MCCKILKHPKVQSRIIRIAIVLTFIGLVAHVVCIVAENWYSLEAQASHTSADVRLTKLTANIWTISHECTQILPDGKSTKDIPCDFKSNTSMEHAKMDRDYTRTMKAFGILVLILAVIAFSVTVYSLFHARSSLRRLASAMLGLTAMCEVVLLKVFFGWVQVSLESIWKPYIDKNNTGIQHNQQLANVPMFLFVSGIFGYGYYVAWAAFSMFAISALLLILASRPPRQKIYFGSTRQPNNEDEITINLH